MPPSLPPEQVKLWLSTQLKTLDSVRNAQVVRDVADEEVPDIVVRMWTSALVHVHVWSQVWKIRPLRRVLGEATRVGIGTLIVVDHALVPPDGARLIPEDGLVALHALQRERIYTYRLQNGVQGTDIRIGQVHFKAYGRDEVEVWYGPDIEIAHLPVYKVYLKAPNAIRGEWLMASFGSDTFWKSADYTASRAAFRQQERSQYTTRATWSSTSWGGMGGGDNQFHTAEEQAELEEQAYRAWQESQAARQPGGIPPGANGAGANGNGRNALPVSLETRLEGCYGQLGLERNASQDEVKTAFRRLAREFHPDVSPLPHTEAERRFKLINEAYQYIKTRNGW